MKIKAISQAVALSLLLCSVGGAASAASTSQSLAVHPTKEMVQLVSDVVYAQVPDRGYVSKAMTMDLLVPCGEGPYPAIVYINGGGFINANKDGYIQQRLELAEHGYVIASITYRVAPASTFPAPLEDVKSAIRYLRAHADQIHIDSRHIGVMGGSAGGYLAAFAGTTSGTGQFDSGDNLEQTSDVQAVVDLYGVSDLTAIGADYSPDIQKLHRSPAATEALWINGSPVFGGKDGGIDANPKGAAAANPISYISDKTPPFLLMHGDADTVVSPSQTEILRTALARQNIEAQRYVVEGAGHGGPLWIQPEIMKLIIDFFDTHLK